MNTMHLPQKLPLMLAGDSILMPSSSKRIKVDTPRNMKLVKEHLLRSTSLRSTIIGVIPGTKDPTTEDRVPENVHQIGTAAIVVQITGTNWPQPHYTLLAHGLCRFAIKQVLRDTPYLMAQVTQIGKWPSEDDDIEEDDEAVAGLASQVRREALQLVDALGMSVPVVSRLRSLLRRLPDHTLPDVLGALVKSTPDEKMKILDAVDVEERLRRTLPLILRQLESIKFLKGKAEGNRPRRRRRSGLSDDIQDIVVIRKGNNKADGSSAGRSFKITPINPSFDRGEEDDDEDGLQALERKLKDADLPSDVRKVANRELKRLKKMPSALPDHALTHNYLELMAELPWSNATADRLDLHQAKLDLDEDHYSMDKLKKRVLEYLAVRQLQVNSAGSEQNVKGPILCFVGPPGVGKTSVGRSIARTLGRKFHRISLGGVCDQSDIRGHRRTYVGSMPGRIISGLKTVGVNNPVFLLDEVDKLGKGLQGDPGAALLEVLDPEQNHTFVDHYLNVPFDLSSVLFIATANTTSTIPAALLDRMEVIEVPGYTQEEKLTIAQRHLLPKQLGMHGLPLPEQEDAVAKISLSPEALMSIIGQYTREAGVRDLDRKLAAVCRAVAVQVASAGEGSKKAAAINIDADTVKEILGPILYDRESAQLLNRPGVAAGLAWTRTGGEIMYVEASRMDSGREGGSGIGEITLTGQLGDVMKESAQLAVSWLRSNIDSLRLSKEERAGLSNADIHLHFPAGAVGKDGPSAGVTIVTALVSLFSGRLVHSDLAMTGEITLRGLVLPVGGIKEKVLAAHRAGMKRVLLPKRNERDVKADLPENILKQIDLIYVSSLEDVLAQAFTGGNFKTSFDASDRRPKSKL